MKPINERIKDFLDERDISPATRNSYKKILKLWIDYLVISRANLHDTKTATVLDWKQSLSNSGKSILTISAYLKVIGLFYKWGEENGYHQNITKHLKKYKSYRGHKRKHLENDQVKTLLNSIQKETLTGKRNFAIINLQLRTGLRGIEISRLSIEDLFPKEPTGANIKLQRKNHTEKDALMGITDKSYNPIKDYLLMRKEYKTNEPLFINHGKHQNENKMTSSAISRMVTNELIKCNLKEPKISMHSLRHTFATTSAKLNVSAYDLQIALGHYSINTTQIYLSSLNDEKLKRNEAIFKIDESDIF